MRSRTIAFFLGVLGFWCLPAWPPSLFAVAVVVCITWRIRVWWLLRWLLMGFAWAWLRASLAVSPTLPSDLLMQECVVIGRATDIGQRVGDSVRFTLHVERTLDCASRWHGRVRVGWYDTEQRPGAGSRWRLVLKLREPRGLSNPAGFDYERWLFAHRIGATAYVRPSVDNKMLSTTPNYIARMRQYFYKQTKMVVGDHELGPLLFALTIGYRADINDSQWATLRATGTTHLMVISGLHIGLMWALGFGVARALLSRLPVEHLATSSATYAIVFGLVCAACYALLAGFTVPTQRALVMVSVAATASFMVRRCAASTVLCCALMAVLLFDPLAPLSSGFWLSFFAVAIIVASLQPRRNGSQITLLWRRWGRLQFLLALAMAPLTAYLFGVVSLAGPVANAFAIPWVSFLVVPSTMLGMFVTAYHAAIGELLYSVSLGLLTPLWWCLQWLETVLPVFDVARQPSAIELAFYLFAMATFLVPRGFPARWLGLLCIVCTIFSTPKELAFGSLKLTVLDVGQGLSVIAQTRTRVMVYDTGPAYRASDAGERVVTPYLRSQGIRTIDTLVVSHSDRDHAGGVRSLLRVFAGTKVLGDPGLDGVKSRPCERGDRWLWDGVSFEIMHPLKMADWNDNNRSCVVKITSHGVSVLLTGDIERAGETEMLFAAPTQSMRADVMIAPHHGSKTSSSAAFVEAVSPRWVVFAVGYQNRWHLPNPVVVARYRERGVQIASTARHGAITFTTHAVGPDLTVDFHRRRDRHLWRAGF